MDLSYCEELRVRDVHKPLNLMLPPSPGRGHCDGDETFQLSMIAKKEDILGLILVFRVWFYSPKHLLCKSTSRTVSGGGHRVSSPLPEDARSAEVNIAGCVGFTCRISHKTCTARVPLKSLEGQRMRLSLTVSNTGDTSPGSPAHNTLQEPESQATRRGWREEVAPGPHSCPPSRAV